MKRLVIMPGQEVEALLYPGRQIEGTVIETVWSIGGSVWCLLRYKSETTSLLWIQESIICKHQDLRYTEVYVPGDKYAIYPNHLYPNVRYNSILLQSRIKLSSLQDIIRFFTVLSADESSIITVDLTHIKELS